METKILKVVRQGEAFSVQFLYTRISGTDVPGNLSDRPDKGK